MNPAALSFSNVYDAFKNNDYQSTSLAISGTVATGAVASYSGTVTLDRADSVTQIYFSLSANAQYFSTGNLYLFDGTAVSFLNGSTPTFPGTAAYTVVFSVSYSSTTLTITATIFNPYAETLTPVAETVSYQVYTFVAPFVS